MASHACAAYAWGCLSPRSRSSGTRALANLWVGTSLQKQLLHLLYLHRVLCRRMSRWDRALTVSNKTLKTTRKKPNKTQTPLLCAGIQQERCFPGEPGRRRGAGSAGDPCPVWVQQPLGSGIARRVDAGRRAQDGARLNRSRSALTSASAWARVEPPATSQP